MKILSYIPILIVLLLLTLNSNGARVRYNYEINATENSYTQNHFLDLLTINEGMDSNIEIYNKTYTSNNIEIVYPQIKFEEKGNEEAKVNDLIYHESLKILGYYNSEENLDLKVTNEIKFLNNKIISIVYSGVGYLQGSAYPENILYTTNIDLENCNKIKLADVINIDDSFITLFRTEKSKQINSDFDTKSIIMQQDDETLTNKFYSADMMNNIETEQYNKTFSYFTPNSLVISLGVQHVIGDHAEIEINYGDILEIN